MTDTEEETGMEMIDMEVVTVTAMTDTETTDMETTDTVEIVMGEIGMVVTDTEEVIVTVVEEEEGTVTTDEEDCHLNDPRLEPCDTTRTTVSLTTTILEESSTMTRAARLRPWKVETPETTNHLAPEEVPKSLVLRWLLPEVHT